VNVKRQKIEDRSYAFSLDVGSYFVINHMDLNLFNHVPSTNWSIIIL
jgi:hypothetical protein